MQIKYYAIGLQCIDKYILDIYRFYGFLIVACEIVTLHVSDSKEISDAT